MQHRAVVSLAGAISLFTATCGSVSYHYAPDKELKYTQQVNGKKIEIKLNPTYHDLTKPDIISSYLNFSETQANWANLESIDISLYDGDKMLPLKKSKLRIAYWDGKSSPDIQKENFKGALHELYPPHLDDYKYNDTMMATFSFDQEYKAETFPEKLKQKLMIRFKDKTLNFENNLHKKKFEKSLISGRPFG